MTLRSHTIKHVGVITLASGEWNLYDQYPTNRRDYKITSAVHIGKPAQSIAFTTDASLERWIVRNMGHAQLPLL